MSRNRREQEEDACGECGVCQSSLYLTLPCCHQKICKRCALRIWDDDERVAPCPFCRADIIYQQEDDVLVKEAAYRSQNRGRPPPSRTLRPREEAYYNDDDYEDLYGHIQPTVQEDRHQEEHRQEDRRQADRRREDQRQEESDKKFFQELISSAERDITENINKASERLSVSAHYRTEESDITRLTQQFLTAANWLADSVRRRGTATTTIQVGSEKHAILLMYKEEQWLALFKVPFMLPEKTAAERTAFFNDWMSVKNEQYTLLMQCAENQTNFAGYSDMRYRSFVIFSENFDAVYSRPNYSPDRVARLRALYEKSERFDFTTLLNQNVQRAYGKRSTLSEKIKKARQKERRIVKREEREWKKDQENPNRYAGLFFN